MSRAIYLIQSHIRLALALRRPCLAPRLPGRPMSQTRSYSREVYQRSTGGPDGTRRNRRNPQTINGLRQNRLMEAAGIEPASEGSSSSTSTCVVRLLDLANQLPGRQGSCYASPIKISPGSLRRRSTGQPALVDAPVKSRRRDLARRATL